MSELRKNRSTRGVSCWAHFLFGRCEGKCFVELARLIVLFHVGLAQFFVGAAPSKFPIVGLLHVFARAMAGKQLR